MAGKGIFLWRGHEVAFSSGNPADINVYQTIEQKSESVAINRI